MEVELVRFSVLLQLEMDFYIFQCSREVYLYNKIISKAKQKGAWLYFPPLAEQVEAVNSTGPSMHITWESLTALTRSL